MPRVVYNVVRKDYFMSLPTTTPAEVLEISPEALEVANTYLQVQSIDEVAKTLDIDPHTVANYLDRKDVKAYINQVFFNLGFNNRFRIRQLLDSIIQKKLQDMDEAGVGSSKDIMDILETSAKITMQLMDKEIEIMKLEQKTSGIRTQTNIQINDNGGSKYEQLMSKILGNHGTV